MSILWITENYYPNKGGMAQSCDRIVSGLRDNGIKIDVIHLSRRCRRRPTSNRERGEDRCWSLGDNPTHELNVLWNHVEKRASQYRSVIAYGTHYALIAARNYAAWLQQPLFTMVRGNDFDSAIFDYRRRSLIEEVYRHSEKIICVSQDKRDKIKRIFTLANAVWIPNGINLQQWHPLPSCHSRAMCLRESYPKHKKTIGLFGHLKEKKGGLFFLETLLLSNTHQQLHILLVGEVEPLLMQWLDNHSDGISFSCVAFTDRNNLIPYYLSCDVVAIPSFYDGTPNVLLEAAALAIPILAANVGGMKDILTQGETALLFEPGDLHALRSNLDLVVHGEHNELKQLGLNAQKTIENHFTHTQEVQAYLHHLTLPEQKNSTEIGVSSKTTNLEKQL